MEGSTWNYVDRYVSLYVKRPCACCLSCGCTIFLLGAFSVMVGFMAVEQRDMVWSVWSNEYTQWGMALIEARDSLGEKAEDKDEEEESIYEASVTIYYKTNVEGTGTMFTPERLQSMCKLEAIMMTQKLEDVRFTWIDSPVMAFYNAPPVHFSNFSWDCPLLPEARIGTTMSVIMASLVDKGPLSPFSRFVHPTTRDTGQTAFTMSRSFYQAPTEERAQEVVLPLNEAVGIIPGWFRNGFIRSGAYVGDGSGDQFVGHGPFRVRSLATAWGNDEVYDVLPFDFLFALGSVCLVWIIMSLYLRSTFLGSMGMFQIIWSLPISCIIYKAAGIDYFEFLHVLVVYLVLGIGADDVFVLIDTFRHHCEDHMPVEEDGAYSDEALHIILRGTMTRTAGAIFNTSFTTAVAFAACSVSKVMPMRTCGYYAALCIIFNYIFTMTFAPAFMIIWHRHLQGKRCCCPGCGRRREAKLAPARMEGTPTSRDKGSVVERMLQNYYIPMMRKKVGPIRIFALAIAVIMFGVAVQGTYYASQLTPPSKPEMWVPAKHMWLGLNAFQGQTFYQPDFSRYSVIEFFWGVKSLDMAGLDIYTPANGGAEVIWDEDFDLSTPAAQESFLETCRLLQTAKCEVPACIDGGFTSGTMMMLDTKKTYSCFLEDFKVWNNGTLPTGAEFEPLLKNFTESARPEDYTSDIISDYVNYKRDIGFVDGKLRFVVVKIRSTIPDVTPYSKGIAVRDVITDFVVGRRGAGPEGLNRSLKFMDTWLNFSNYALSAELIVGFFQGCAIAMPVAFLVLLFSTRNIVVAIIAVGSVGSIVLCVLGFCKSVMDWDLGIGEAISGVIVIGYSVDYVVHLAHTYMEAKHHGCNTRDERCTFAIQNMGSTVFMGAVTTAGAGSIMFCCFLYFFFKMAVIICVVILYSFLFSLGFFMSVMWLVGPENSFGDLCMPRYFAARETPTAEAKVGAVVAPELPVKEAEAPADDAWEVPQEEKQELRGNSPPLAASTGGPWAALEDPLETTTV